jgi:hypothetical protein
MAAVFFRPMPDWTDRYVVAAFAADSADLLGNDSELTERLIHLAERAALPLAWLNPVDRAGRFSSACMRLRSSGEMSH